MSQQAQARARRLGRTSGMSLIEIMVVIMIIGLFVGVGVPRIFRALSGAKVKKTRVLLPSLKATIVEYHSDTGQYPARLEDLYIRPSDPKISSRWHQYVEGEDGIKDGWGNQFVYKRSPAGSKHPFELYSWGGETEGSPKEEWLDVWNL